MSDAIKWLSLDDSAGVGFGIVWIADGPGIGFGCGNWVNADGSGKSTREAK